MATKVKRPGYLFLADDATANFSDNFERLNGKITQLKIINDSGNDLQFTLNREIDSDKVDGIVKNGENFRLDDINQGIGTIGISGSGAFRLWAYH